MNNKIKTFREELKEGTLIFDGGMGTYLSEKQRISGRGCEMANIDKPILVSAVHREYLESGARAIKTNTFGANRTAYAGDAKLTERILRAGWRLASQAAEPYQAHVFADIGPVTGQDLPETAAEYRFLSDIFIGLGAKNFLFETNASPEGLKETAAYIRSRVPDAYIIVSYAILPGGYTRDGLFGEELLRETAESPDIDAVGFNCISGVRQMLDLLSEMDLTGLTLSVMPNSGSPVVIGNRTVYQSDPEYFGNGLSEIASLGVPIVGGCCGTTPKHIAAAKAALARKSGVSRERKRRTVPAGIGEESRFWRKLEMGAKPVAVELDPPGTAETQSYMDKVRVLRDAGADIITISDCPTARARMDSSLLACMTQRDAGIEVLPHLTCRDRNLNASKALLLGLSAENIRNVLVVTGDPIPTAERDEVKSVYQFNSRKMAAFIRGLGRTGAVVPFHIFGALNLNARNFDIQLGFAKEKIRQGMTGFLTQPVLSWEAADNLRQARRELDCPILGGILPIISERNANFMNNEVSGIRVAEEITAMYKGLSREEAEELAVKMSIRIAETIVPDVDGFYIMTPFQRVHLVKRILEGLRGSVI